MKLALGTVQFGLHYGVANTVGRVSSGETRAIIHEARTLGIDMLDTAIAYGDSEIVLGQFTWPGQQIVTKLPAVPEDCDNVQGWIFEQFNGALERLGTMQVYGFLLHRPEQLLSRFGGEIYRALETLKLRGKVCKIGVSIYDPAELDTFFKRFHFDIVQAPMNILDRRILHSGWAQRLHDHGVELHTRSVFLQGLLLLPSEQRPARFGRWSSIWIEWDRWLAQVCMTPLQACLRFSAQQSVVERLIIGVDSVAQLKEVASSIEGKLTTLPNFETLHDDRLLNPATWSQL